MSKEYKKAVEANRKYNYERKIMNDIYMRDIDREKRIESIFNNAFFNVENEINRLYMSYAKTEGISLKEAKKRASEMDVKRFQDMAKKAVENKDFSAKANYWLKIYNLKMRVSRYELMKASISLEIQNMYTDSVDHIQDVLEEEILNEIENQAGILAPSFEMTKDDIEKIINMDFQGKNFSKRVWDKRDGYYRIAEKEIFKSLSNIFVHKMGYQKEMSRLSNTFKASKSQVLRLLKTEVSRANSQARDKMYKENGFTHYRYVCEPGACPICKPMDNKVFKLEDREIGVNAAPMHPNCRCRDYGIIEMFKNGKSNIADDIVIPSKSRYNKVSGGVSGAITRIDDDDAKAHADLRYVAIRKQKYDVSKIAKRTGFSKEQIQEIKNYLFIDVHDLGDRKSQFDPDFAIAQSWDRLTRGNIEKHDLTLIKHEIMEKALIKKGYTQDEAHKITSKKYNYKKEAGEYYANIKKRKKREK